MKMKAKWFGASALALPIMVGGIVLAAQARDGGKTEQAKPGYTCPVTGEELPCPKCCPLNK